MPPRLDVRVELAGHTVRLQELRARPERYARWFSAARHDPGHARCLCTPAREQLVIRAGVAGRYHLARWPHRGDHHHRCCPFSLIDPRHPAVAAPAARPGVSVTKHGLRIAVDDAPWTTPDAPDEIGEDTAQGHPPVPGAPTDLTTVSRPRTRTMTGLGLLAYLWDAAGLTTSQPRGQQHGRRGWGEIYTALLPVLARLRFGEQPAPALCHLIAPYRPQQDDPAREARLAAFLGPLEHPEHVVIRGGPSRGRTRQLQHRRLLLGELKELTAAAHGHKLALRHFPRPVFLPDEAYEQLTRGFPAAFSTAPEHHCRRIVLALVEGTPHGYLRLVGAAVMLVSSAYLPTGPPPQRRCLVRAGSATDSSTEPAPPGATPPGQRR